MSALLIYSFETTRVVCCCGRAHNVSILCTFSVVLSKEILITTSSLSAEPVYRLCRSVQEHAAAARGRGRLLGGARYAKVGTITGLSSKKPSPREASKTLQWHVTKDSN